MLAGRAKNDRSDVDIDKGGRRRVHVESVRAHHSGRMVIAGRPPIRCQRTYPSVILPYARSDPSRTAAFFAWDLPQVGQLLT